MANASNFLSASPDKTTQKLRSELESASKALLAKKDFSNIGKLKVYAKYLPFIPLIEEKKSLTNLSNFVLFIKFFLYFI